MASFRALADAGAGGHLIVHSTDPEVQAALEAAGVAGSVEAPQARDVFGAFASNADGTKIDFYGRRSLSYRVDLGEGGGSTAEVALTAENTAPEHPERSYVFGPYPGPGLEPGVSEAFVSVYCAPGRGFQDATLDGKPQGLEAHRERGLPVFSTYVQTTPGTTSALALELQRADAWSGDELGGTYLLRIRAQQPVLPTQGTISILAPPGMDIVEATLGMHVDGGRATGEGDLNAVQDFEIRFQRPPLGRLWDWFSRPVFGDRGRSAGDARIGRVGTVEQVPGRHEHLRPLEDDRLRRRVVGPPRPPVVGFAVAQHMHDERESKRPAEQPPRAPGVERGGHDGRAAPPAPVCERREARPPPRPCFPPGGTSRT